MSRSPRSSKTIQIPRTPESSASLAAAAHTAMVDLHKELKGVTSTVRKSDPPFKAPNVDGHEPKVNKSMPRIKKEPIDRSISPVTHYVRSLPGGPFFTAQEVAEQLGCSVQAIRKYAKTEVTQAPSHYAPFGRLKINLYTTEDVQALKDYIGERRQVFPSKRSTDG